MVQCYFKRRAPTLILKFNFAKAFDSIDWGSLRRALLARGFPPLWCDWMDAIFHSSKSAVDVGITLWATCITLPPTAQPGVHEDHSSTKVGRYVGSKEGFLTNKARRRRNKENLGVELFVT
jgi:hypothetical protein